MPKAEGAPETPSPCGEGWGEGPPPVRNRLSGYASRLLIIPLAAIVFGAALGAGFQWGGPGKQDVVRVFETSQQGRSRATARPPAT